MLFEHLTENKTNCIKVTGNIQKSQKFPAIMPDIYRCELSKCQSI